MSRKYLVVDDNKPFAENVAEILAELGAEVCLATEGNSALAHVSQSRFDVVLTDMVMPGVSGAELVRRVRDVDADVPVVLLSAYSNDAQIAEARRYGLLAFLNKPVPVERLIELLSKARRKATVVLLGNDASAVEQFCKCLAERGFTVCIAQTIAEMDSIRVKPMAVVVDGRVAGSSMEHIQARFPDAAVWAINAVPSPENTQSILAELETLASPAERAP
jgi:CheY-like chemotaxis protein